MSKSGSSARTKVGFFVVLVCALAFIVDAIVVFFHDVFRFSYWDDVFICLNLSLGFPALAVFLLFCVRTFRSGISGERTLDFLSVLALLLAVGAFDSAAFLGFSEFNLPVNVSAKTIVTVVFWAIVIAALVALLLFNCISIGQRIWGGPEKAEKRKRTTIALAIASLAAFVLLYVLMILVHQCII